jgi:predicted O-methyltransferase YrrM
MNDSVFQSIPSQLTAIENDTKNSGFTMPSERKIGSLLKNLVSSKPGGHFLELGTGTGLSTAWILSGMDLEAELQSIDNDEQVLDIARQYLDNDSRVTFHLADGEEFINQASTNSYDLIFADAWPGKYNLLDETLALLNVGGFYVIDDMSPQPNWPDGHADKAHKLLEKLNQKENLIVCRLDWATGIVICTRTS